eukprot:CAMPEP_0168423858 /NCGR_PEP_ID=MMETSP0228-20121227/34525_1 /TAXON_ID=133427 /ORGANISM="Protoceratium reticulatum, Strain CCCM 535 (=CCMP 1889)" /LENGTH=393 /DNA_ID=CAMNT_0008437833 /DNA_START=71 /DNA_END=1248 /DNA_ORIENTATION=-
MGIKGLMKFLQDAAPKAVHDIHSMQAYTGRLVAIDASMCLYQFLIMIREGHSGTYSNLTNEEGRVTSHLVGMLTRTIRLMEAGIKPVYVFDGKPPDLKLQELDVRRQKRDEASANLQAAMEAGDSEQVLKSTKASVKVTKEQNEDTKKLLRLMGIPVVEAPSEAEATCAALCRDGKVYASATEDADCLTFGTKILIRNLMAAESQKKQIMEVRLDRALEQLNISMDQFIDFCILCGCDYCNSLKGIGPATAIRLLLQHGTLENVVAALAEEKVPKNFRFQAAREFFKECEAVNASEISFKFEEPDFAGLTHFLVEENSFSKDRVDRYVERLKHAVSRTKQKTLDTFFGTPKVVIKESDKFSPSKRKSAPKAMAGTALATTAAAPAPAPALAAA